MRIGPADLRRALGSKTAVVRRGRVEPVEVVETRVTDDGEVEVEVELEPSGGDVSVRGVIRAAWEAPCRRCTDPLRGTIEAEVMEVFALAPVEGETYPFDGEEIDLAPMVHDAVTLELPLAPGPPVDDDDRCLVCGREALVPDDAAADEPARDPRWAALDELDLRED